MSDRTWNQIDAKLYEEDWSQGAIIVASCLLSRCPNQYGVYDMPWGFLRMFFKGLYTRNEIEGFALEWESSGFVKFYRDRSVVWIRKKWKRSKYHNVRNNQVGAIKYLVEHYPDVVGDFTELYGLSMDLVPTKWEQKGSKVPTSDSESDSESDSKIINCAKSEAKKECLILSSLPFRADEEDLHRLSEPLKILP